MPKSPQQDPREERFIERFGLASEAENLPRIAGRIFGLLLLEGGPMGFEEIALRLRVSRGSVSTNTRLLETLGVIERVSLPGDRRDYFRISDQPGRRMLETGMARMRRTQAIVTDMRTQLGKRRPAAGQRLRRMARFYEVTIRNVEAALRELESNPK